MALLTDIIEWANGLKPWQQESLRRIFANAELTPTDKDVILQLALAELTPGPLTTETRRFTIDDVPGVGSGSTVRLLGLSSLDQVNGFPAGRAFELPPDGMVILFGQNGAGKSGYARVLKNACKSRHRVEVLPNAFDPSPGIPSADFTILVDGEPVSARWTQNGPPNADLSSVVVYDVACANDYIDSEGVPAFQPYGLAQLTRLAIMQRDMQARLSAERVALSLDIRQFDSLRGDTAVGRHIANLGEKSDREELLRLGQFTELDMQRLSFLKQTLLETNPEPKAVAMDRLAARLDQAAQRAATAQRWVSDKAISRAKELIDAEKAAHDAMTLAQIQLKGNTSGTNESGQVVSAVTPLMNGTGNTLWQTLYRAAEAFSQQSAYPSHAFPHLDLDAQCVLCQQPYSSEAADRMRRFSVFVADSATKEAQGATKARMEALAKVKAVDLQILDAPTMADVSERLPDLQAPISRAQFALTTRHSWVMKALESGVWITGSPDLPPASTVDESFVLKAVTLRANATALRASADPARRLALTAESAELEARRLLADKLPAVERFILDSRTSNRLGKCHALFNPQVVSRKLTALASKYVTDALAAAMNRELSALGYRRRVRPELSGRTDLGTTKVTLRLSDVSVKATKLLSEGEQRAVGLAMFLAELEAQTHLSTVVFDDPSTSLDHIYRRAIAERLVTMADKRQVLIFTHDAVFLTELAMALQHADRTAAYKTISWDDAPGLVNDGLTWATMDTKARLNELRMQAKALDGDLSAYPSDEIERKVSIGYTSLRGTIERSVREVFLNNTVQPFSDVISVESFGAVIGHPKEEWESLQSMYGRACEVTEAHDTPGERQLSLPRPERLVQDIQLVIGLVESATTRKKLYQTERNAQTTIRKKVLG